MTSKKKRLQMVEAFILAGDKEEALRAKKRLSMAHAFSVQKNMTEDAKFFNNAIKRLKFRRG